MARPIKSYDSDEFLRELESYTNDLRDLIESECSAFAPGVEARKSRIAKALVDYKFFVQTYFPHYVPEGSVPSEFHAFAFDKINHIIAKGEGCKEAWAESRGGAKSTLVTNLLPIWCTIRDEYLLKRKSKIKYIPIAMDTVEQARTMLAAIKAEFEANPRLKGDFGAVCGAGRVWNVNVIVTANNIKIEAFGSGKKMRGLRHGAHRPGLVILDDIENDENVQNKEQRDKTYSWVNKTVLPLGPPDGSLIVISINTILHYDSAANRFQKNPAWRSARFQAISQWPDRMDLWDIWEQIYLSDGDDAANAYYWEQQSAMDAGARVSWPSMRPLLMLMKTRAADHHAFDCEYQNDPSSSNEAPFKDLHYWVQPSRDWVHFGAHDPSMGKNNKSRDPSASLVGAYDRNHGKLDVVEAKIARILPDAQIAQIIDLQCAYQCRLWSIETVQFQEFFYTELIKRSAEQGVHVPVQSVKPLGDKDLRIMTIQPYVANGLIRFSRNHRTLIEQLIHYPEANDDGPDALQMLWALCVSFSQQTAAITSGRLRGMDKYNCGL